MTERNTLDRSAPGASAASRDELVLQVNTALETLLRLKYFTLDVVGAEHVPRQGPVVYAQNHAGWFALDTIMLGHAVGLAAGIARTPYFAAHEAALTAPIVGPFLTRLGGLPASSFRNPERLPAEIESYGICPEGVRGNCKPFWQAYRMREWSRTFVKLAVVRDAPIVPVAVFGGEECLPVAWTVEALKPVIGSIVGLPLLPLPLPTHWKVVFHRPIRVSLRGHPLRPDREYTAEVARQVQSIVQATLDREAARRPLGRLSSFVAAVTAPPTTERYDLAAAPDPLLGPEDDPGPHLVTG